jgi:hypothetical protein
VNVDRILAAMDFTAMEYAYRLNFAEYHRFLTENGLSHRLPKPVSPAAGKPLSALNTVKIDFSVDEISSWFRSEIDFISKDNEVLRTRAWNLELALHDFRNKTGAGAPGEKKSA